MTELFDYIKKLKELDSLKDELRSLKSRQDEEIPVSIERPTKELQDLVNLLSSFNGEIDLISLLLGDSVNDCVKIKTVNRDELIKMVSNLRRLPDLTPDKLMDINILRQKLQDANISRKDLFSLIN